MGGGGAGLGLSRGSGRVTGRSPAPSFLGPGFPVKVRGARGAGPARGGRDYSRPRPPHLALGAGRLLGGAEEPRWVGPQALAHR